VQERVRELEQELKSSCAYLLLKGNQTEEKKAVLISFAQSISGALSKKCMKILATAVLEEVRVHISLRGITRKPVAYTGGNIDDRDRCVRGGQRKWRGWCHSYTDSSAPARHSSF
jgi:hypothetical protein